MSTPPLISLIVCTRNRADELAKTLAALARIQIPPGGAELVIVDNASTDDTPQVIRQAGLANLPVRSIEQPLPGLSNARNLGLRAARGEIIIFTDDDVRPAGDWVMELARPLIDRRYHAVVGRVEFPPELARPWMTNLYTEWLAGVDPCRHDRPELMGANMAFHRSVLEKVPEFDPELGAGALGFAEETLFSRQLEQAGFHLGFAERAVVVHHFGPSRLRRGAWLDAAHQRGQADGYLSYHWLHDEPAGARLRWMWWTAKLALRRLVQPPAPPETEGCAWWEISYVRMRAKFRQIRLERTRPRNYARLGLVRLNRP